MDKRGIRGVVCGIVGGACWGFSGCCGQYLFTVKNMDARALATWRLLISGIVLFLICMLVNRKKLFEIVKCKADFLRVILFGVFGLMFCQYSYLNSIKYSNAPTATVIQYIGPVMVMVVVCIMNHRKPTKPELLSVFMAALGTFLIATHGNPGNLVISSKGFFWCMIAAMAVVIYTLVPGDMLHRHPGIVVNAWGMLIGGIVIALLVQVWKIPVTIDSGTMLGFAGMTFIGTIIAFTLYLQALADIGPIWTGVLASMEIVASTIISYFWFGNRFEMIDWIGVACIVSTVFLLALKKNKKM